MKLRRGRLGRRSRLFFYLKIAEDKQTGRIICKNETFLQAGNLRKYAFRPKLIHLISRVESLHHSTFQTR